MLIPIPDARIDKDAVVIGLCYAALTNAAMLGTCRLDELAGTAYATGGEESVVVRVETKMKGLVLGSDVAWISSA